MRPSSSEEPVNPRSRLTNRSLGRLIRPVLAICFVIPVVWLTFANRSPHPLRSPANPSPNPTLPTVRMVRISPQPALDIRDLIVGAFFRVPIILVAEFAAVIYLSRKQVKGRLLWVMSSYVLLVSLAMAFALLVRDEFGFSFIPVTMTIWPWYHILSKFPVPSTMGIIGLLIEVALGAALNCAIFYLIDRLSYPKHSARLSDRHAT